MSDELIQNPDFAASKAGLTFNSKPLGFIDVGARGGVHKIVDKMAASTAVLAFEPDPEECERLRKHMASLSKWASYAVEPIALAQAEGESQLFILSSGTVEL